jgi:nitrile hydratase
MNGVHDMGGMHNLGPIEIESDEPVFHAPWEGRVFALNIAARALDRWTIDSGRHQRELIPGPDYLRMSYYEKWAAGLEASLLAAGLVTEAELATGRADTDASAPVSPLSADRVGGLGRRGVSYERAIEAGPRFSLGQRVRARNLNPPGHTRLPRYARGHRGVVVAYHGAHVFPDSNAHGLGEQPQPLYQVRFEARELWGDTAGGRGEVCLDLWEPYLDAE